VHCRHADQQEDPDGGIESGRVRADRLADRLLVGRPHPYWELTERGEVGSPDGAALQADARSDPRDESGYSAGDLISLGFVNSPAHPRLVEESKALADVSAGDYDAVLFVGGQGAMYTFHHNKRVHDLAATARLVIEALGQ
jgi:hypothetical protein